MQPRLNWAFASPWSAALRYQRAASAWSCGSPWPSAYMQPRLNWAPASFCSAALRYQRAASAWSCGTPWPLSWVNQTLRQQRYEELKRSDRGVVRQYVEKMAGLSRAQTTRLITVYLGGDEVKPQAYRRRRFARRYTGEDIALLAGVDEAHETLSGPATKKLLQRACYNFNETRFQSLARISVAQLYRLRGSRAYRERRIKYQVTRPTRGSLGEGRKPEPQGRPGCIRIDTVHQGDQDGVKGVYHINAVDEVTQWEVVGSVEQISESFLIRVLEAMLAQFPFRIRSFHSDNGSEFINHMVADLLNKLLIEQTKSRPRH